MTIPDVFLLMLPFLLIVVGTIMNPRGIGIAFYLMATFTAWMTVAYPQLSAATSTSSTEYTTGILYLIIGIVGIVLAIVTSISIETEGGKK